MNKADIYNKKIIYMWSVMNAIDLFTDESQCSLNSSLLNDIEHQQLNY